MINLIVLNGIKKFAKALFPYNQYCSYHFTQWDWFFTHA